MELEAQPADIEQKPEMQLQSVQRNNSTSSASSSDSEGSETTPAFTEVVLPSSTLDSKCEALAAPQADQEEKQALANKGAELPASAAGPTLTATETGAPEARSDFNNSDAAEAMAVQESPGALPAPHPRMQSLLSHLCNEVDRLSSSVEECRNRQEEMKVDLKRVDFRFQRKSKEQEQRTSLLAWQVETLSARKEAPRRTQFDEAAMFEVRSQLDELQQYSKMIAAEVDGVHVQLDTHQESMENLQKLLSEVNKSEAARKARDEAAQAEISAAQRELRESGASLRTDLNRRALELLQARADSIECCMMAQAETVALQAVERQLARQLACQDLGLDVRMLQQQTPNSELEQIAVPPVDSAHGFGRGYDSPQKFRAREQATPDLEPTSTPMISRLDDDDSVCNTPRSSCSSSFCEWKPGGEDAQFEDLGGTCDRANFESFGSAPRRSRHFTLEEQFDALDSQALSEARPHISSLTISPEGRTSTSSALVVSPSFSSSTTAEEKEPELVAAQLDWRPPEQLVKGPCKLNEKGSWNPGEDVIKAEMCARRIHRAKCKKREMWQAFAEFHLHFCGEGGLLWLLQEDGVKTPAVSVLPSHHVRNK
mmetsp:Transcript_154554/g.284856  ORF Transcript_154554/g.284856 Transcript_154554/m.284856 type:complete len:599 (-) Transcript_154554:29-1825(-)